MNIQSEASALEPSWLERYDAVVLQGVDEMGQVREQRSRPARHSDLTNITVFKLTIAVSTIVPTGPLTTHEPSAFQP